MGLIGDATGGLGDKLTAITDKLLLAVPGIEQPVIDALHADIADLVQAETAAIAQAGAVIQADLTPLIAESEKWLTEVQQVRAMIEAVIQAVTAIPSSGR